MPWLRRLWNTFRPGRLRRDIDRELSFHLAERVDQLRAEGLSDEDAARRARVQFGNVALQAERTRDVDIELWTDGFLRNVRYAARTLARTPGFTATVVLTLALGIGANTAVFSAIDAVLLQPLPFPESDRLMRLSQRQDRSAEDNIAPVRLEDWNRLNATFEAITGYFMEDVSETSGDLPERVRRAWVAARFFEVWGVAPAIGRGFTAAEHRTGGPAAVVISDRYWRQRLGADSHVLARTVRIGAASFPVVGVMPASFLFPERDVDLWFPSASDSRYAQSRKATWYEGAGRLKRGVSLEQARADLALVQKRLGEQYPDTDRTVGVEVEPLKEMTIGGIRPSLWLVFGAVSLLLLITCTNVAALLLSRGAHRRQEIAVRLSLGASRASVAAQLLTETGLLTLAGGSLGLLVAAGAAALFRSTAAELPRMEEVALDGRILLYTLAIAVAVALLCGLLPAIRSTGDGIAATNEAGRTHVSTRNSLQWLLVGAQVALSVTLLAGAGLLVRSIDELSRVDPGFEPRGVLAFRVSANWAETVNYPRLVQRIDGTLEALRAVPGVIAAATTGWSLPGVPAKWEAAFRIAEAGGDTAQRIVAEARSVSPEYFQTMQIPVVAGELCRRRASDAGAARTAGEALVNRTFAALYLPAWPSAVGLHLADVANASVANRIVGIVGDAREQGLDRDPAPTVYWCMSAPNPTPYFLVRTSGDSMTIARAVRLKMKELEPLRAVYDIAPVEERIGGAFRQNRLRTVLLVVFSVAALSLACVGVYGTLSYVVSLRRREIGLRLALGARRGSIVRQFVMQGLRIVALACAGGLALSLAFGRMLSGMLYGVSPSDPATLSGVVGIVLIVAALAALLPAVRAALLEPMHVLRE